MAIIRSMSRRDQYVAGITLLLCLAVAATTVHFTLSSYIEVIRADAFRQMSLFVIPSFENSFSPVMLWSDHHPKPVQALLFLVNAHIFNLDFLFDVTVGLVFLCILVSMIAGTMIADAQRVGRLTTTDKFLMASGAVAVCITAFSLSSTIIYRWPLVTLGFFDHFIAFLPCLALASYLRSGQRKDELLVYLSSLALLVINFDRAFLVLVTLVGVFILSGLVDKERRYQMLRSIGVVLLLILAFQLVLVLIAGNEENEKRIGETGKLLDVVVNPVQTIDFVATGLASSIFDATVAEDIGVSPVFSEWIKYCLLILYLSGAYLILRYGYWRNAGAGVALFLIPMLFMLALLLFRHSFEDEGVSIAAFPRYRVTYHFGWVGLAWIVVVHAVALKSIPARSLATLVVSVLIAGHAGHAIVAWNQIPIFENGNTEVKLNMLRFSEGITSVHSRQLCPHSESVCNDYVAFLKKHELNLFAPRYKKKYASACLVRPENLIRYGRQLRVEFSEDVSSMPIQIEMGARNADRVRNKGELKILTVDKNRDVGPVTLKCFRNGGFEPFGVCSNEAGCMMLEVETDAS